MPEVSVVIPTHNRIEILPEVIDATTSHFDSLAVEESGKVVVAAISSCSSAC